MLIEWTSSLETGIRHIDLQHRELVDLINNAAAAHARGEDDTLIHKMLPTLNAYILFHFGTEESLLNNSGVDSEHARRHREAHRLFATKLDHLETAAAANAPAAMDQLLDYLQGWLCEHIMKTDRELGRQLLAPASGSLR